VSYYRLYTKTKKEEKVFKKEKEFNEL